MFHELSIEDSSIRVKVQQPQKTMRVRKMAYKYQFMSPDCSEYTVSFTNFVAEQPENYKWNLLDNYVINRRFRDDETRDMFRTTFNVCAAIIVWLWMAWL